MDFAGLPSTAGWAPLASAAGGIDLIPERDAPVVARLRAAGAVILGKTNIPAFSHDGARANTSWDGPTFNAVDRAIAPGASSSGTATAIAASFAVVGLAEETGGSIQNPAAAQSLVSVKPTFALVPNTGVAPLAGSTRDVVGPHARTVTDAALLLDVLAGYTPEDPKTVASIGKMPEGGYASELRRSAEGREARPLWPGMARGAAVRGMHGALRQGRGRAEGARRVVVEDPFAGSGFADLAMKDAEFDDRGLEMIAYDMEMFLRRLGPSAALSSFAAFKALVPEDPFESHDLWACMSRACRSCALAARSHSAAGPQRLSCAAPPISQDLQCGAGRAQARRPRVSANSRRCPACSTRRRILRPRCRRSTSPAFRASRSPPAGMPVARRSA